MESHLLGCGNVLRFLVNKIGEDWVFLFMLGTIMALLSFGMDTCIAKLLDGRYTSCTPLVYCLLFMLLNIISLGTDDCSDTAWFIFGLYVRRYPILQQPICLCCISVM